MVLYYLFVGNSSIVLFLCYYIDQITNLRVWRRDQFVLSTITIQSIFMIRLRNLLQKLRYPYGDNIFHDICTWNNNNCKYFRNNWTSLKFVHTIFAHDSMNIGLTACLLSHCFLFKSLFDFYDSENIVLVAC